MGTVSSTQTSSEFYLQDNYDNKDIENENESVSSSSIVSRLLNCGECGSQNSTLNTTTSLLFLNKGKDKKSSYYWSQYEDDFDMNQLHTVEGPYLGTSYWDDNIDSLTTTHTSTNNNRNNSFVLSPTSSLTAAAEEEEELSDASSAYMMEGEDYDQTPRIRPLGDDSISTAMTTLQTLESSNTSGDLSFKSSSTTNVMVTFTPKRLFGNHNSNAATKYRPYQTLRGDPDEHDNDDIFLNPPSPIRTTQLFPNSPTPSNYRLHNHKSPVDDTVVFTPDRSVATTALVSNQDFCGALLLRNKFGTIRRKKDRRKKNTRNLHGRKSPKGDESIIIKNGVLIKGIIATPSSRSFSSSADYSHYIPDGIRDSKKSTRRHVNTLPSFRKGQPIRIRMTESYEGFTSSVSLPLLQSYNIHQMYMYPQQPHDSSNTINNNNNINNNINNNNPFLSKNEQEDLNHKQRDDIFSYDPLFSKGQYTICTPNGHLFGNGLNVSMGPQFMTLQDKYNQVYAVTRSRKTFIPSHIIYSPKPRYEGQKPSSHRPQKNYNHHSNSQIDTEEETNVLDVYPWALIQKKGRKMEHEVSIHFVKDPTTKSETTTEGITNTVTGNNGTIGGLFDAQPAFLSRHGFDGKDNHTHTLVSRTKLLSSDNNSKNKSSIPCCIILRNPISRDLFDITIAPGIDPLLMICYFTIHSRMDVEPILSDM